MVFGDSSSVVFVEVSLFQGVLLGGVLLCVCCIAHHKPLDVSMG